MYLGDIVPGQALCHKFTTVDATGAPTVLTAAPLLVVYKDDSTAENSSAISLTVDFDGKVGMNHWVLTTGLDPTFYSSGSDFQVAVGSGTVSGVSLVGYVIGAFSINKRSALRPIVDGRSLAVSAAGVADSQVKGLDADTVTASAIAANAIGASEIANDAITSAKVADGFITAPKITDGSFTAAKFAAGAFDAVWTVAARTLTSFGTLVADVATAVWGAATRTLTAFGFTANANLIQIGGDTGSLDRFKRATDTEVLGTAGVASTTTSIVTSSLSPLAIVVDQFKGRVVLFDRATTTTALRGQGTRITASSAGGVLTVEALSNAPASGDTFVIV